MRWFCLQLSLCLLSPLVGTTLCLGADLASAKAAYNKKDYATAFKELTPLVKQGNAEAEVLLGRMYFMGYGVLKDSDEAQKLFAAAANQGNADGEFFVGMPSVMSHQNVTQGLKWLQLSAEQGNQDAQLLLGKTYLVGLGSDLPRDPAQADMWLRLAANHNLPFYQNELLVAERRMNAADIANGKAMAGAWKPKHRLPPSDMSKMAEGKPKS